MWYSKDRVDSINRKYNRLLSFRPYIPLSMQWLIGEKDFEKRVEECLKLLGGKRMEAAGDLGLPGLGHLWLGQIERLFQVGLGQIGRLVQLGQIGPLVQLGQIGPQKISISSVLRELISLLPVLRKLIAVLRESVQFLRELIPVLRKLISLLPVLREQGNDTRKLFLLSNILSSLERVKDEALYLESIIPLSPDSESTLDLEFAYNVFDSVVVLSIVYQYLVGYIDRGGTKTYNSGSLEFRATYVSVLLFQGAYVWIKFRDVASKGTVYRRPKKNRSGEYKYEPRFKPPREKDVVTGKVLKFDCLPLGGYDTLRDAEVVLQIAAYFYGRGAGIVELDDGSQFRIPQMSEQERSLCGEKKRKRVSVKAKEVYKEFKKEEAVRRQSRPSTLSTDAGEQVDARDSHSADQAVACLTADANTEDEVADFHAGPAPDFDLLMSSDPMNVDDRVDVSGFFLEGFEDIATSQENFLLQQAEAEFNRRTAELEAEFHRRTAELEAEFHRRTAELEAEFHRRTAEQDQILQHLEEKIVELQREIEHMQSIIKY